MVEEIWFSKEESSRIIGKKGEMKKKLEKALNIKLNVSEEGKINVECFSENPEISEYLVRNILDVIALGFSLSSALTLLKENIFERINIKSFVKSSKLDVVKSRIIGTKGKAKRTFSFLSDTEIVVKDNFVGIVGLPLHVELASKAIHSIMRGAPHSHVFKFLEKGKIKLKRDEEEIAELREKLES